MIETDPIILSIVLVWLVFFGACIGSFLNVVVYRLPRGKSLKIIACGFDAPLADALFIKSLIYYAESFQATEKAQRRDYTYDLFDVITDLSPRFYRAYQVGGLFLTSSSDLKANRDGIRILNKGVEVYNRLEKQGEKVKVDPRWNFHVLIANAYEVNIQTKLRAADDFEGASDARKMAAAEFFNAAKSPNAPGYVIAAAAGYESIQKGMGNVEDSRATVVSVWKELYHEAESRNDTEVMTDLLQRIEGAEEELQKIGLTREVATFLSEKGQEYVDRMHTAPVGVADLIRAGLVPGQPITPLSMEDMPDQWLALPDGSFKSLILSIMESNSHMDVLFDAIVAYRRINGNRPPPDLQTLVDEKFLEKIPEPPLAALGETYLYSSEAGGVAVLMPEGPQLPPDRR